MTSQTKRPAILVYQCRREIQDEICKGNMTVQDIQSFLLKKNIVISRKWLSINLKKLFPEYVVNNRWRPLDVLISERNGTAAKPVVTNIEASQGSSPDKEQYGDYHSVRGNVVAVLDNGLIIYEDIEKCIPKNLYELLRNPHGVSGSMIEAAINELTPGRRYLRELNEEQRGNKQ